MRRQTSWSSFPTSQVWLLGVELSLDWHSFFQAARQARHVRLARPRRVRPPPSVLAALLSNLSHPSSLLFRCSLPAWCPRKRSPLRPCLPTDDSVSAAPLSRSHPPKNVRFPPLFPSASVRPFSVRLLVFWRRTRRRRGVGRTTAKEGKAKCCHRKLSSGNGDRWGGGAERVKRRQECGA